MSEGYASAEERARRRAVMDQAVRARVEVDALGRRMRMRPREDAVAAVEEYKARQRARSKAWSDKIYDGKLVKQDLVRVGDLEVKCTLCGRVSSKFTNRWGQHEEECKHYVPSPPNPSS